jgi:hypothetical protein
MMDVPALAICPDMDASESIPRLIATLSGVAVDEVREDMSAYGHFLEDCPIQFSWDDSPSIDDIYLELDAYVEAWDMWPKLILLDNLLDIDAGDGEYEAQKFVMNEMKSLAKRTGACVIVLTHTQSENGSDYSKPQSRDKIKYKVDQKPQLILTLGREGDLFRIAVVKDRNSKATDPTAKRFITIQWQGDTASDGDILAALRQAEKNAGNDLPFVLWRPNGYGEAQIDQWVMAFRNDVGTRLLRAAGYGTPLDKD